MTKSSQRTKYLLFIVILFIGLFFRNYKVVARFDFAHDHDLYSWIARDIIINHHFRLIGQLTSADGIYIGPLYYYINIPFFLLFNMDPVGSIIPISILGLLSIISIYFVIKKLYNQEIALFTMLFYSASWHILQLDRRIAPSTSTYLWSIWYFYCLINIVRGNFKVLPILGLLIGLIWHVHIAILPSLLAIPVAFLLSRKIPTWKYNFYLILSTLITSLPLIIFEIRHNFIQTTSLIANFSKNHGGAIGFFKFTKVIKMLSKNMYDIFFTSIHIPYLDTYLIFGVFIAIGFTLVYIRRLKVKEYCVLLSWLIGLVLFFTFSSTPISEYYFANVEIVFLFIIGVAAFSLWEFSRISKIISLILVSIFVVNTFININSDFYNKGYLERKEILGYILQDMKKNNYPCISINYITAPGENVGFRYLLWLYHIKTIKADTGAPIYDIVIPDEYALNDKKSGHIGLILPKKINTKEQIEKSCRVDDYNITNSMFGYTQ